MKLHLLIFSTLFFFLAPVLAQNSYQLEFFTPGEGQIESGEQEQWLFSGISGQVISVWVRSTSADLDPKVSINGSGGALIDNDDYAYPDSTDSLLEAITLPRTETYTIVVSGMNETSGDYTINLLPGFSQVERSENFNGTTTWQPLSDSLIVDNQAEALSLSLAGTNLTGLATDGGDKMPTDYYAQVEMSIPANQDAWEVGWAMQLTDAENYYRLTVNERGEWRFLIRQAGEEQILRSWTPHPAIIAGNHTFTLGIMVHGSDFDFFYNQQSFGSITDASLSGEEGIGLAVQTSANPNSRLTATFDDLTVTEPLFVDGEPVLPQQLIVSAPNIMVKELKRRNVIPAGGEMALTVAESFVELSRPGVERYLLGRGTTFQQFALGTTISWDALAQGMTGCGLIFSAVDDAHYDLAYLDQTGGYGVSRREGESFVPGIFGERILDNSDHHLLVIAEADHIYYYVDGQYSGTLDLPAQDGMVGSAVVNFEPISTSCRFTDTWLWRWE